MLGGPPICTRRTNYKKKISIEVFFVLQAWNIPISFLKKFSLRGYLPANLRIKGFILAIHYYPEDLLVLAGFGLSENVL